MDDAAGRIHFFGSDKSQPIICSKSFLINMSSNNLVIKKYTMLKRLVCTFSFFLLTSYMWAQSSNTRAQGYYYKAKSEFELEKYESCIQYLDKSKESLGGTNPELQYLYVMALVEQEMWSEANAEMTRFFHLKDRKEEPIYFENNVDGLTDDEEYELIKMMVEIEENAKYLNSREGVTKTYIQKVRYVFFTNIVYHQDMECVKDEREDFEYTYKWAYLNDSIYLVSSNTITNSYNMYGELISKRERRFSFPVEIPSILDISIKNGEDSIWGMRIKELSYLKSKSCRVPKAVLWLHLDSPVSPAFQYSSDEGKLVSETGWKKTEFVILLEDQFDPKFVEEFRKLRKEFENKILSIESN